MKHDEEDEQDVAKAVIKIDWKRKVVYVNDHRRELTATQECEIVLNDLVSPHVAGFNRLHKKLEILLHGSHVSVEKLLIFVANSSLIRISHIEEEMGIPRYLGKKVMGEFKSSGACISTNGAMRKTLEYMETIRDHIKQRGSQTQKKPTYQLPPEVGEIDSLESMSVEMLLEELRVAEKMSATPQDLERLRHALQVRRMENRAQKGGTGGEFAHVMAIVKDEQAQETVAQATAKKKKQSRRTT